jgi:DnaK suppressor protein
MLFGKKACDQRETALHDLLSYARSFDLRLDQCRSLAINEFEGNPRINRDVTRDQPQADSDTRRVEHRWVSLSAVDCAFERLRQGRYGFCEACGNEISLARLKIAPCALYCVDCQHKRKDLLDAADHHSDEPLSSMAMEPAVSNSTENYRVRGGRKRARTRRKFHLRVVSFNRTPRINLAKEPATWVHIVPVATKRTD